MEGKTRRTGLRYSVIELLEDRALMSVMTSSAVPRPSVAEGSQVLAVIESIWANHTKEVPSTSKAGSNEFIPEPVTYSNVSADSTDLTSVDWSGWDQADLSALNLVSGGISGGNSEGVDTGNDAGFDSLSDLFFAEWASSAPSGKGLSSTGLIISPYGQTSDDELLTTGLRGALASSATTPVMLVDGLSERAQDLSRMNPEAQAEAPRFHDGSVPIPDGQTGTASRATRQVMAELLDGVESLDWERLEHDLGRFLSRISGIQAAPVGPEKVSALPTLVAIFMTALVAREAARREGWWRERLVPGAEHVGGDPDSSTGPIGPWPLGSP